MYRLGRFNVVIGALTGYGAYRLSQNVIQLGQAAVKFWDSLFEPSDDCYLDDNWPGDDLGHESEEEPVHGECHNCSGEHAETTCKRGGSHDCKQHCDHSVEERIKAYRDGVNYGMNYGLKVANYQEFSWLVDLFDNEQDELYQKFSNRAKQLYKVFHNYDEEQCEKLKKALGWPV